MANYCNNKLTVKGNHAEVKLFKQTVYKDKDTSLCFNNTVKMPDALEGTESPNRSTDFKRKILIKKHGTDNWYDWRITNWGCKWEPYHGMSDAREKKYANGRTQLVYEFSTAWSPPIEWVQKTSELFPNLTFKLYYNEEGMGFKGTVIVQNGEEI